MLRLLQVRTFVANVMNIQLLIGFAWRGFRGNHAVRQLLKNRPAVAHPFGIKKQRAALLGWDELSSIKYLPTQILNIDLVLLCPEAAVLDGISYIFSTLWHLEKDVSPKRL